MVYGLWFMVYGLWFMVYGLWFMVYGLWFILLLISNLESLTAGRTRFFSGVFWKAFVLAVFPKRQNGKSAGD